MDRLRWDVFCRVVDNHGDVGVCWRLCCDLASRGQHVRLWIDDPRALRWMAPACPDGCSVHPWPVSDWQPAEGPGQVVIEAFGCNLPDAVQARLPGSVRHWFNLEYLSAEPYVERSHGLPSPVLSGPAQGCTKRFWYPGFTARTGGLLREPNLLHRQLAHDPKAFLQRLGVLRQPGERLISIFCYPHAPLDGLVQWLDSARGAAPVRLLICGDTAAPAQLPPAITAQRLPWLSQSDYDALLWSCDLNVVRGEDSFVRAIWAGQPLLWHIYRQDDEAHHAKLEAFMDLWEAGPDTPSWRRLWRAWNQIRTLEEARPATATEAPADATVLWSAGPHAQLRARLLQQKDLCSQLLEAVQG